MSSANGATKIPAAASSAAVRHMRRWEGVAVLVATLACWSSVPLFVRHLAEYIDHWTNNGWRYGASALFWLPAVLWALGLLMGLCNVLGAVIGARMAIARGSQFVRVVFLAVVGLLILRLGWDLLG